MTKEKKTTKTSNKNKKNAQNKKEILNNRKYDSELSKVIKCILIVLIIFIVMYLITVLILKKSSTDYITQDIETTSIQYDEILAGTSFNKKDSEYLVLFYDIDEDEDYTYSNLISNYQAKDDKLPIYYVDLSNSMNKSVISEETNKEASNASELKINGSTLIKFSNNSISEYIEGEEAITNYLNN